MRGSSSRLARVGALVGVAVLFGGLEAVSALAAPSPGLPRTYQVQRVDPPIAANGARWGAGLINMGDANGDGKDDFASVLRVGTLNGNGAVFIHSGATGALIRQANMPDDPNTAGGTDASIVDPNIDRLPDVGSCPGGAAGATCPLATVGAPDGVDEILVGAQGVDVGGVPDVGRAYVFDGATLAVLKRIDMPPADRALQALRQAEFPFAAPANLRAGGFGRTVQSPRGLPPCAGNGGVGDCPASSTTFPGVPAAARIGDMDGGGRAEIVVGANRFHETAATAFTTAQGPIFKDSQCATSGASLCFEAGRTYIYRGEDVAGSNPAVILDTPLATLKNPVAQGPDFGLSTAGSEIENFGHVQIPVGDVGQCRVGLVDGVTYPAVAQGDYCLPASSTNVPDGRPELIVASHRVDIPFYAPDKTWFDVGAVFLIDGATRSILHVYEHPEPQPGSGFGFILHSPFAAGDMGPNAAADNPDFPVSAFRQNAQGVTGSGRDYLMNGNFKVGPNQYNFGQLNDPTPTIGGNFGSAWSALGDVVPSQPKNELIVGGFGSQQPRGDQMTDMNIFNPFYEKRLQQILDPDQQPDSKFGSRIAPLGDLNGDGFLDFVAVADQFDNPSGPPDNQNGRAYIFRSDNSPPPASGSATTPPAGSRAVTRSGRSVTLSASKKRVPSSAKITIRGRISELVDNSGCEGAQSVAIQRSKKKGGSYKTVKTVRTKSSGAFSLSLRPKSTYYYRARLSQTASCLGATSKSVRVAVSAASGR